MPLIKILEIIIIFSVVLFISYLLVGLIGIVLDYLRPHSNKNFKTAKKWPKFLNKVIAVLVVILIFGLIGFLTTKFL